MANTGRPLCNAAGAMLFRGSDGSPLWDGVPFPTSQYPDRLFQANGKYNCPTNYDPTYPAPLTKANVWPSARSLLDSSAWTGFGIYSLWYPYSLLPVYSLAEWYWNSWTGWSSAGSTTLVDAARFNMSSFVGRHLTSITFTVQSPTMLYSPVTSMYVSLYTQSGDTPPTGVSWIPAGTAITGTGSKTITCDLVLSNYLFVVPWIANHECPDAVYQYPTYYENEISIFVSPMTMSGI